MKRALLFLAMVLAVVAGIWGYAYELAFFLYFNLNVHDTLGPRHFIYTGLVNIGPMFGIMLVFSLVTKFFSWNITRDDVKTIHARLAASKFSDEIVLARVAFLLSLVFMLLVVFDVRLGRENGIGYMFWFFTFLNIQLFYGSLCLSPPQSRAAVVFAFVLSVAMCFVAGGVSHARFFSLSKTILRDDSVVQVHREGEKVVPVAKAINVPIPLLDFVLSSVDKR